MVRWGTVRGIGSFSTTVPENACTGGKERGNFHEGSQLGLKKLIWHFRHIFPLYDWHFTTVPVHRALTQRGFWEFGYVLIKGSEAQWCNYHEQFHTIGILCSVSEIKDQTKERGWFGWWRKDECVALTSNLLAVCVGAAPGLSSSVIPSLVSLCAGSSWLRPRPITLRSSKSAALLSLVSLHTLFSLLRDFRMDFLGNGSPFFTSTNNLPGTTKTCKTTSTCIFSLLPPTCFVPVNVCRCCDFVQLMMGVTVAVAVFPFPLRVFLLLLPLAELQGGVFARVDPHLKQTAEAR